MLTCGETAVLSRTAACQLGLASLQLHAYEAVVICNRTLQNKLRSKVLIAQCEVVYVGLWLLKVLHSLISFLAAQLVEHSVLDRKVPGSILGE